MWAKQSLLPASAVPVQPVKVFRARSTRQLLASLPIQNESLLLAPTRAAADELIWTQTQGTLSVHRFTLAQLATQIAGTGKIPVTPLVQESLLTRTVDQLLRENQLPYFSPIADTPGFVRALSSTTQELRSHFVNPNGDLSHLLKLYEESLEESDFADLAEVYRIAAAASDSSFFGLPLYLLDIPIRTRAEEAFLLALIRRSPAVTVLTLSGDDEFPLHSLEAEIIDLEESNDSSLSRIRQYLFVPETPPTGKLDETFEYFSAPGEGFECVEIARRIQRSRLAFDRVAVLLRHPGRYQPLLEEAFRRAGVPCYFSAGTIQPDPAARAFLALLRCALEQYSATRFAEYLSLGQTPRSEDQPTAPFAWEQLIIDASVIGGPDRWERRLTGLANEFRLKQETPDFLIQQLESLQSFAIPLITQLTMLPHGGNWHAWIEALSDLAQRALRHPEGVEEILSELEPMKEIGPVSLEEVEALLSERLGSFRHEPPPRRFGSVFIGTIEEARGRHFDQVFVPGLAEGLFPQRAMEDPLLLDEDRKLLGLPTQDTRFSRERLLLRIAAATGDRLVVSYPRMDTLQSRARVPSFYAFEVIRAAIGQIPDIHGFEETARSGASVKLGWPAPEEPEQAVDDTEYDLAILAGPLQKGTGRYMLEANPTLVRALRSRGRRWRSRWYEEDGLIGDPEIFQPYHLTQGPYSATALQRYSTCPYQFALHSIFKLRPRKLSTAIEQMDPLTRGTLFHQVQRNFLESSPLLQSSSWEELLSILDQTLNQTASEFQEKLAPAINRVWENEIEGLRTDLRGWLRELILDKEWIPQLFESKFDEQLAGVHLKGVIDVVEKHTARDTYRITDYKTGKPPKERITYVGGGSTLQPLFYAEAFAQKEECRVETGRLFYATQRGGYQPIEIVITDQARESAQTVLKIIGDSIEKGTLIPAPAKEACKTCDYQMVCGPYEEVRVSRKQQDRLAGLQELRRLP